MPSRLTSRGAAYARQSANGAMASARMAAAIAMSGTLEVARQSARVNSYTVPTNVLSSIDTGGGTAKISIANHTRVYPVQGDIDVPDLALVGVADITGVPNATTYDVYYDDTTLQLVAPAAQVTTDPKVAQVGYADGRHFLGTITTAAAGGAGTGGNGGLPPGGGGGPLP